MVDFSKFSKPAGGPKPTDPREIFKQRPAGEGVANDLWQGQAEALRKWYENKSNSSLILLNTGAGKTYVGLLIAQSLINQGKRNVLYLCSTIDLVHQTKREADKLGIKTTLRIKSKFSSEEFEQGRAFCITTYQSALNARSIFSSKFRPEAIIFDDAHVAERILRDQFTLRINREEYKKLYWSLYESLDTCFTSFDLRRRFRELKAGDIEQALFAPPTAVFEHADRIEAILASHIDDDDPDLLFPYELLKDHVKFCTVFVNSNRIEIAPPFLPALTLHAIGGRNVCRVFLSATLDTKADFGRAFGRLPEATIEPDVDAGNGERLILFADAFANDQAVEDAAQCIAKSAKILVAVPSGFKAARWKFLAKPNIGDAFTEALNTFRAASTGNFILVGRYDGIDLPGSTCRVMILDGLPTGGTLLERYQFESLYMDQAFLGRVANRLVQLFGRINRGRSDYGIFFVADKSLGNWLKNERNRALLPELLRHQIFVGEDIQQQMGGKVTPTDACSLTQQVLKRDTGWVDFYRAHIGDKDVSSLRRTENATAEQVYASMAKAEVLFMSKLWDNDTRGAREALNADLNSLAVADPNLAGWYSVWIGITHFADGNRETAFEHFDNARKRLGRPLPLPRSTAAPLANQVEQSTIIGHAIMDLIEGDIIAVNKRLASLKLDSAAAFAPGVGHKQAEEAVKIIGFGLGFVASRPCTEFGTGPDGLWVDETKKKVIGFELKTDKDSSSTLNKGDIAQGHDHIQWIKDRYPSYELLGLLYYTDTEKSTEKGNASPLMFYCSPSKLRELLNDFLGVIEKVRALNPTQRGGEAAKWGELAEWQTEGTFGRLAGAPVAK